MIFLRFAKWHIAPGSSRPGFVFISVLIRSRIAFGMLGRTRMSSLPLPGPHPRSSTIAGRIYPDYHGVQIG